MKQLKGFTAVKVFLLILVLGMLVGAGIYMYKIQKSTPIRENAVESKSIDLSPDKWTVFEHPRAMISFKYPPDWKIQNDEDQFYEDTKLAQANGRVISPSGKKLEWIYAVWGGKGGDCEPDNDDVIFASGNYCNSKKILTVEKLMPLTGPKNYLLHDDRYITKTKYRSAVDLPSLGSSQITYQICLDVTFKDERGPTVHERMGLVFPCEFWDTGFNAQFRVRSEAELYSEEAETAEQIMRTFETL